MGKKSIVSIVISIVLLFTLTFPALAAESEASYKQSLINAGFPSSYVSKLYAVHKLHPNWVFKPYNTGLDWNTALNNETTAGKNTVYITPNGSSATRLYRSESFGSYTSKAGFDYDYVVRDGSDANQSGWTDASRMAVAYYMNPMTFIGNDVTILQYESLGWSFANTDAGFDEAVSTVKTMLNGTFMASTANNYNSNYIDNSGNIKYVDTTGATKYLGYSFAYAICLAAKNNNLNPCYLTSKILGEVGNTGSGSVTGTYANGLVGYYNYLNVGAYDSSTGGAITNGLTYAKNNGWTNPYLSISGGAATIAASYIARGQDTPYFQKFNVTSTNRYSHQYMTAVNGVVNTTYSTYTGYKNAGVLESKKTFTIPVFNNMPDGTGTDIALTGYNGGSRRGTANTTVNLRSSASYAASKSGSVAAGSTVTVLGGYRDYRVSYDPNYSINSTYYRMFNPLWYKVKTSDGTVGYVCEDYLNVNNNYSLKTGAKLGLTGNVAGSEKPSFMSMDTRIATVDTNGTVTGVSAGTTKIVAFLSNGSFDVLYLTVGSSGKTPSQTSPKFNYSESGSGTVSPEPSTPAPVLNGICQAADGNWYYFVNNNVDTSKNGVYNNDYGWWKVENGKVNFSYEGLAENEFGWWYLKNGCVDFNYNGLVRNEYGRWYVSGGAVQFGFNGIVPTSSGKWYVRDGNVKTQFTGTATINGKNYTITNGKVG